MGRGLNEGTAKKDTQELLQDNMNKERQSGKGDHPCGVLYAIANARRGSISGDGVSWELARSMLGSASHTR
jgi:hypothetical protein